MSDPTSVQPEAVTRGRSLSCSSFGAALSADSHPTDEPDCAATRSALYHDTGLARGVTRYPDTVSQVTIER